MTVALRPVPTSPYASIPAELRVLPQWIVWRYEERGSDKPTKVPFNPRSGYPASVTNPDSWSSFDDACSAACGQDAPYSGIGFVLTRADPYSIVDLDDTAGDADAFESQRRIYDAFDSYSEMSPSRRGLHIVVRGTIDGGRRRGKVEVYSYDRYFTFTGQAYGPVRDIADRQEHLSQLFHELRPADAPEAFGDDAPEAIDDATVIDRAHRAANGAKFAALHTGDWQANYSSQSEADFAYVNMLSLYSGNREQVRRLFLASLLGQREKAQRSDYVARMVERSFDRVAPAMDFSAITDRIKSVVDQRKVAPGEAATTLSAGLLPTISASAFFGKVVAPRAWHVADMVPARTVTLLGGDGGTGKSLVALQLAVSTVAGWDWFGSAVRQGACLFLTAEDEIDEVHRRLASIVTGRGMGLDKLPALALSSLAGRDALLALPDGRTGTLAPTALYAALRGYVEANRPVLVVLDTLADLFGGEENNRAQVRQFVGLLRSLALDFDTTLLLLAHPSLTGISSGTGLSGSTAWNNSVRSRLYLKRDADDPHARILETMKSNYGATGQQIRLRWEAGAFVEAGRTSNEPAHRRAAEQAADELFLRLLAELAAQGQTVSPAPSSPTFAPKLFAANAAGSSHKRDGFVAAMNRLLAAGRIRVVLSDGPPSKRKNIIVAATPGEPASPPANLVPAYAGPHSVTPAIPPANSCEHPACSPPIPP